LAFNRHYDYSVMASQEDNMTLARMLIDAGADIEGNGVKQLS